MGSCTSKGKSLKGISKQINSNLIPDHNEKNNQESQDQPHLKTSGTTEKRVYVDNIGYINNTNCEKLKKNIISIKEENLNNQEDGCFHLTFVSQECLQNIQNKKFLQHIRKNSLDSKSLNDDGSGIQKKDDFIIEEDNNKNEPLNATETGCRTLITKRPKFQIKIEENKVDLKVDLGQNLHKMVKI